MEFYDQGDKERKIGLPISPFMDRRKQALNKLQISFIGYLVIPMVDSFVSVFPEMKFAMDHITYNKKYWDFFNNAELTNLPKYEDVLRQIREGVNPRDVKINESPNVPTI